MGMSAKEDAGKKLYLKTLNAGFLLLVIFFVGALLGVYLGKAIDGFLDIYPFGLLFGLAVSYVLSMLLARYILKSLNLLSSKNSKRYASKHTV